MQIDQRGNFDLPKSYKLIESNDLIRNAFFLKKKIDHKSKQNQIHNNPKRFCIQNMFAQKPKEFQKLSLH